VERLKGKVAVITGATSGIGLAATRLFAQEGAHVYAFARGHAGLDAVGRELGERVTAVQGDVTSLGDLARLYRTIAAEKGSVDVVYANAGYGTFARIDEVTEEHFDEGIGVNVKGSLFTLQQALPLLVDGG
jgi:NAD(P)-dependent dehydrogenase (short-subunit alcohol dehydrogenase family)